MRPLHYLKISTALPGLAETEGGRIPAFTEDLSATGGYHEITREGLLVRVPAKSSETSGSRQDTPADVVFTGDLRFGMGVPGGRGGVFVARLREGSVKWIERLDYERYEGPARLYYDGGHPVAMTYDEYRARRRADHEEDLIEDHVIESLSPRGPWAGGGVRVETRDGARFEVVPEGDLELPRRPGDEVRLYLLSEAAHDAPGGVLGAVVGVDLNGESVYYETPEEHARRAPRNRAAENDAPDGRAMRAWSQTWAPAGRSGSSAYGFAANEGSIVLPNYSEAVSRAKRVQESNEEAHRLAQLETMSLVGHALNLSHAATPEHPASEFLRAIERLDAERGGHEDFPPGVPTASSPPGIRRPHPSDGQRASGG